MRAIAVTCAILGVVFGLSTPARATDEPLAPLAGTWKVVEAKANGKAIDDPQIKDAKLTFRDNTLLMEPGDGTLRERHKIKAEAGATPAAYFSERIEPAGRPQSGWTIYELKGDRLRIGFFDALKGRPESFDPQPKLLVLELEKADE